MIDELAAALEEHRATPFPSPAVRRGADYGSVCAVMIDVNIYFLSKAVADGHTLPDQQWDFLADCEARLQDSLSEFPEAGRPYYERLLRIADLAFKRMKERADARLP